MTVRELGPPLGLHQHLRTLAGVQDPARRRARRRLCLLKGCEQPFRPMCPQARYCGARCRQAARQWRAWRAGRRYRRSRRGKACRRQQCRRYRARLRRRQDEARRAGLPGTVARWGATDRSVLSTVAAGSEGQRAAAFLKKSACRRPGCYARFVLHPRSPLQCFCTRLCRRALRRVLDREARWRRARAPTGTRQPVGHPPPRQGPLR